MKHAYRIVASFTKFACFAVTAFAPVMMAQSIGSRQPDISDWRLFHRNNDEYWARWATAGTSWSGPPYNRSIIRLFASDIRSLRILAGIADDEPSDPIVQLTGRQMEQNHYLLVTAKPGGCLNVAVYGKEEHFRKLWSSDELPAGGSICQLPGCPEPQVTVDEKHRIHILTFSRSSPSSPVCDQSNSTTYKPLKDTFELEEQHSDASMCWYGYHEGLSVAFRQAAGPGETLAIVRVMPSLSLNRYAIVLQRVSTGIRVLRMEHHDDAWLSKADTPRKQKTALDCYNHAAAVHMKVWALKIPPNEAQNLVADLGQIDLRNDRCARNAEGICTSFLDGRAFSVQVGDNPPIVITDVKGFQGDTSENPQLSRWIYKLLNETRQEK